MPHENEPGSAGALEVVYRVLEIAVDDNVRAVREDRREVDFICSDESVDSYGTSLRGWDLARFKRNPVVLFAHDARDLPVGQATRIEVVTGGKNGDELRATVKFASAEANPHAEHVWRSILEGTLRGISVGFRPHSYRVEMVKDVELLILEDNELYELSVTPCPSNPNALAQYRAHARSQAAPHRPPMNVPPTQERGGGTSQPAGKESAMTAEEKAALEKQLSERAAKVSELESKLDTAEAKQRATDADLKVERERGVALRAQNEALVKERDTLKVRAETAETGLIARDVDAIVGKKITPAERDWAIKLRTADKGLFDEMVAQRSDLNLTNPLLPPAPNTGAGEQRAAARSDESGELFDELANQKGG